MASYTEKIEVERRSVPQQADDLIADVAGEVKHEAHHIREDMQPVDPTHSDHVVRRHVAGLSIWFFVVITFFLLAVIAIIAIYMHGHHEGIQHAEAVLFTARSTMSLV